MTKLYQGDCLEVMKELPDKSIDMVLCDLPFGITNANWDKKIEIESLWNLYDKKVKDASSAIVLFASQPFSSELIFSKMEWFRCEWIWNKKNPTNFANAKRHPMKIHESIIVFGKNPTRYFPIKEQGEKNHGRGFRKNSGKSDLFHADPKNTIDDFSGLKFPKSILVFPKHTSQVKFHPTQKPVALLEYLIKTYSLEGETVLDNTMGSGSTGVACVNTGRNFVGIELDKHYFEVAEKRISESIAEKANSLFSERNP